LQSVDLRRSDRGTSLVEAVIAIPLLLFLLLVVVQIGWIGDQRERAEMAAGYAARAWLAGGSEPEISNRVTTTFFSADDRVSLTVTNDTSATVLTVSSETPILFPGSTRIVDIFDPDGDGSSGVSATVTIP